MTTVTIDTPSLEQIHAARADYRKGVPVSEILLRRRMSNGNFYRWLDGGPLEGDGRMLPPIPRRQTKKRPQPRPTSEKRAKLVTRLWRAAQRQVDEIERCTALKERDGSERERDARALAVLVKTMRELTELDAAGAPKRGAEENADDGFPRDIDELRRELARRMQAIVARRNEAVPGEPAA
jgi:hypothetical protein